MTPNAACPVLVLGVGNILLRDEGVGVRVVEAMAQQTLPPGVEIFDGATAGLDLLDTLAHRRKVILIDAMDGEAEPGTVLRLQQEDLVQPDGAGCSLHELGVLETLIIARRLGIAPREVVILGVRPFDVSCGLELSPQMARRIPRIIEAVMVELGATSRSRPLTTAPEKEQRP
jgi:hydrogenase maturation protease